MRYCPFCGAEVDEDSIYCLNCGKKIPEKAPTKDVPAWETTPTRPYPSTPAQPVTYRPLYQPRPYHPSMKAPPGERLVAALENLICLIPYLGVIACAIYGCVKDSMREGQSLGKGFMNLRVVDYNTGMPATIGQSFIRNCLCGWLDAMCCCLIGLLDQEGRRFGDQIAGTVVIIDR